MGRGVHAPKANDAFFLISRFPLFSENFRVWEKISPLLEHFSNFSTKISFQTQTFLMTLFLVVRSDFLISPYFKNATFPPVSENLGPSFLPNFPLILLNF